MSISTTRLVMVQKQKEFFLQRSGIRTLSDEKGAASQK